MTHTVLEAVLAIERDCMSKKKQDKEAVQKLLEGKSLAGTDNTKDFYVYVAEYGGVVYYVGKGSKTRYKHCNSGKSGNAELNRLHFLGVTFNVYSMSDCLTEQSAFLLEDQIIKKLNPLFNVSSNPYIGHAGIKLKGLRHKNCRICGALFTSLNVLEGWKEQIIHTGICMSCDEPYGLRD